jgi:hypothetical protein
MSVHDLQPAMNTKAATSIAVPGTSTPVSSDNVDPSLKDPTYQLIAAAKEAYNMKKLAGLLSRKIAQSEDVRNLAHLVQDSSRELERSCRMAACISNVPVSTKYPYLPAMPTIPKGTLQGSPAAAGPKASSSVDKSTAGGSANNSGTLSVTSTKQAGMESLFPALYHRQFSMQFQRRRIQFETFI